jgi:membrane-associated phospholipid phosphatase
MNYLSQIIYFIGRHGPVILFVFTILLLWTKKNMLFYYLIGFAINSILNLVLKGIIQHPRPMEDKKQFDAMIKHAKTFVFKDSGIPFNIFGMPSGHIQSCFFTIAFTFLIFKRMDILFFFLLITLITLYQRVHYQFHTLFQTIAGGICGIIFGFIAFYLSKEKLKGKVREKRDDYGPI